MTFQDGLRREQEAARPPPQVCPLVVLAVWAVSSSACSERLGTQDWPISGLHTLSAPSSVHASPTLEAVGCRPRARHGLNQQAPAGSSLDSNATFPRR